MFSVSAIHYSCWFWIRFVIKAAGLSQILDSPSYRVKPNSDLSLPLPIILTLTLTLTLIQATG